MTKPAISRMGIGNPPMRYTELYEVDFVEGILLALHRRHAVPFSFVIEPGGTHDRRDTPFYLSMEQAYTYLCELINSGEVPRVRLHFHFAADPVFGDCDQVKSALRQLTQIRESVIFREGQFLTAFDDTWVRYIDKTNALTREVYEKLAALFETDFRKSRSERQYVRQFPQDS